MANVEDKEYNYQTLKEFLLSPFGTIQDVNKTLKYNIRYDSLKSKIHIEGYTSVTDDYYIHIKVPSESDTTRIYDVIIRFFLPNRKAFDNLGKYFVQFFSNSPGFMYQYAVLYRIHGFLIEDLYNKMDPDFINKLPEKSNPNMKMMYDSSIYFACKFLNENSFQYLSKFGLIVRHKKTPDRFFKDISSFKDIKVQMDTANLNRNKAAKKKVVTVKRTSLNGIKTAGKSTIKGSSGIHIVKKKNGNSHMVSKKRPKKSLK